MPCKTSLCRSGKDTCRTFGEHKTKYACIVEAHESMRIRMEGSSRRYHEDRIAGKGTDSLNHHNYINLFLCLKQWKYQVQRQQWKKWETTCESTCMAADESQKQNGSSCRSKEQGHNGSFGIVNGSLSSQELPHWWTSVIWKMLNWRQSTKNTKVELYSEAILRKMIQDRMRYLPSKDHQHHKWRLQK